MRNAARFATYSAARQTAGAVSEQSAAVIETDIPARLDALPFGRFHLLVIMALGITWILDGLEVTLAGALSGELKQTTALGLSNAQIGLAGSAYLAGAVCGAFVFGWLTDRLGRKKLFTITLALYLAATAATGLSWDVWSFVLFRFLTGAGIGGEYTAINSTIQELIPARLRGWTDLLINGSFWIGAAMGAGGSIVLLDPTIINPALGWRFAFLIGAAIGLIILVMRIWIPESPRWLVTHGFPQAAEKIVSGIEARFAETRWQLHERMEESACACAQSYAASRSRPNVVRDLPAAHAGRADPDDRAGIFLQRDLFHLRAGADRILRHAGRRCRLVHPAVRRRQCPRSDPARPAVRHRRAQDHDRIDLRACRASCSRSPPGCSARTFSPLLRSLSPG